MKKKHKSSAAKPAHVTSIAPSPAKMQHVGMSASHGGKHVSDGMAKGSIPKTTVKAKSDKKKGSKNPMEKAFGKMKGKYEVM